MLQHCWWLAVGDQTLQDRQEDEVCRSLEPLLEELYTRIIDRFWKQKLDKNLAAARVGVHWETDKEWW